MLFFFYSVVTQSALSSLLVRDDFTSQCPLLVIWVFFCNVEILIWKVKSFWSHHFNFLVAVCCLFCHWFHNEELVSDDSTGLTLMTSPRPQWEGIAFLRATVSSWLLALLPWNKKWDLPPWNWGFYNCCLSQKPATSSSGADAPTCWERCPTCLKKQNTQWCPSTLASSTHLGHIEETTTWTTSPLPTCLHCFQSQREVLFPLFQKLPFFLSPD